MPTADEEPEMKTPEPTSARVWLTVAGIIFSFIFMAPIVYAVAMGWSNLVLAIIRSWGL